MQYEKKNLNWYQKPLWNQSLRCCTYFLIFQSGYFSQTSYESTENKQLPFPSNVIEHTVFNYTKLILITVNSDLIPPISLMQTVVLQPLKDKSLLSHAALGYKSYSTHSQNSMLKQTLWH